MRREGSGDMKARRLAEAGTVLPRARQEQRQRAHVEENGGRQLAPTRHAGREEERGLGDWPMPRPCEQQGRGKQQERAPDASTCAEAHVTEPTKRVSGVVSWRALFVCQPLRRLPAAKAQCADSGSVAPGGVVSRRARR